MVKMTKSDLKCYRMYKTSIKICRKEAHEYFFCRLDKLPTQNFKTTDAFCQTYQLQ